MNRLTIWLIAFVFTPTLSNAQQAYLDTTFGTQGYSTIAIADSVPHFPRSEMVVQPDGKILLRHWETSVFVSPQQQIMLNRFWPDGSIDQSFGNNGSLLIAHNSTNGIVPGNNSLILTEEGHILTAFSLLEGSNYTTTILCFNNDGQPLPSFGTNGRLDMVIPASGNPGHIPSFRDLLQTSNGNIIVVYQSTAFYYYDFGFLTVYPDGTQPAGNAISWWQTDPFQENSYKALMQPDDRILLAGSVDNNNSSYMRDMMMARFDNDGYINESFGNMGFVRRDIGTGDDRLNDIVLLPNGQIFGIGLAEHETFAIRYHSDGTPDLGFGNNGLRIYPELRDRSRSVVSPLDEGQRLVIGMTTAGDTCEVLRLLANGDIDTTFNQSKPVYLPPISIDHRQFCHDIVALSDHRILVCGTTGVPGKPFIARLLPSANATVWYRDQDEDLFGSNYDSIFATVKPSGFIAVNGDCNDQNPNINPLALDICNGQDDNCNGIIDELPSLVCKEQVEVSLDNSGEAQISWTQLYVPDTTGQLPCNWPIASFGLDPSTFDCSHINTAQLVTLSGTSTQGFTGHCTSTVTVLDQQAPIAICNTNLSVILDNTGVYTLNPTLLDGGSTDNCGIASYTTSINQFTTSHIGNNLVVLTVIDASGNTNICVTVVQVSELSNTNDWAAAWNIHITPNPFVDFVYLSAIAGTDNTEIQYQVMNTQGSILKQGTWATNQQPTLALEMRPYPSGTYFIRLEKEGKIKVLPMVK